MIRTWRGLKLNRSKLSRTQRDAAVATAASIGGFLVILEEINAALILKGFQALGLNDAGFLVSLALALIATACVVAGTAGLLLLTLRKGITDAERIEIKACLASIGIIMLASIIVPPLLGR